MRRISFSATKDQVRHRQKTVTRRLGWVKLEPGERLLAVDRVMGLRKGQQAEVLGTIEVVSVRAERLDEVVNEDRPGYGAREMELEGFPGMDPQDFLLLPVFWDVDPDQLVTRIEFKYVE